MSEQEYVSRNNKFDIIPSIFVFGVILTKKLPPKPTFRGKREVPKVFFS